MTYFIVGMMGAGKTTLGKLLAEHLSLPFYDTDDIISSIQESDILEIFNNLGEAHFRMQEKELIENWKMTNCVVATGGGLPCHDNLMDILNEKGKTIYIVASIGTLTDRIMQADHRPLVAGKSENEVNKLVREMLSCRKKYYDKANIHIKSDPDTDLMLKRLLRKIYR